MYSILLIAISVIISTIINLVIMRQITKIGVKEIGKTENRIMKSFNNSRTK